MKKQHRRPSAASIDLSASGHMKRREAQTPLTPGVLYLEQCPPEGYLLAYSVNRNGVRCFQVQVRLDDATPELIDRWRDDARAIAGSRDAHSPYEKQAERRVRSLRLL
jgi:hypothetical protein